ncbi:hypothetical protein GOODEAATRI_019881 [Goodea atripinnis]|uniref:Uncharacterized protein n=1 Tax=Goodea atripinnis TaxID=208336 RepID=A0ABV0PZF0_9TELE
MTAVAHDILRHVHTKNAKFRAPATRYPMWKLVHALCSSAQANCWTSGCEEALVQQLPLREHHRPLLSHTMFVTMIRTLTSIMEVSAYWGILAMHIEKQAADKREQKRALFLTWKGGVHPPRDAKPSYSDLTMREIMLAMANFWFRHHYENNPHHPQNFTRGVMNHVNLIEAIVDGLTCIFERNKMHTDIGSWLDTYRIQGFHEDNRPLARNVLSALQQHITPADYGVLLTFQSAVFSFLRESIPWSSVSMTEETCIMTACVTVVQ